MSGAVPLLPKFQFSNNGAPMVNGTVTVYLAGTVTPSNTWQDEALTILNTNPIVLDARGESVIYLDPALSYKFLLKNSGGVTQWTQDNIKAGETTSLRLDLAASGGSSLIGGTWFGGVVATVAALATSAGASLLGFIQAGTGSVLRSIQDKLRESVSVKDFGAVGDGVTNDTAAFLAAIAAADVVFIPAGSYLVGNIPINKNNFTLRGAGYNRSILIATSASAITLEVASTAAVSGLVLEDFKIQGNATALGGIKLGSSDANYCAIPMLNRVAVWDYSKSAGSNGFGIQLGCVQNASIHNCWIYRNRHNVQRLQGTGYATSTHISGKSGYLGEGYMGVYIDAQIDDLYIDDVVIEGNNNCGILLTAAAVVAGRGSALYLNGPYLESNNVTGGGVVSVAGGAGAYQDHVVVIDRCNFAVNTGFYVTLDRAIGTIRNSKLTPNQCSLTVNTSVHFENNRYPNAGDYLTTYKALLGNVTVRDTNVPATGTTPNQVNLVNAVTFPATPRPVDDANTLDDYKEGTWTPVLSSDDVAPTYTNVEAADGTFTKIGNMVYCRCKLRVNITAIGTGTPKVTGLPYQPKGLEPLQFSLTTAMNAAPGVSYAVSGPAAVINGAYKVIADGYLIFTVIYQAA